MGALAALESEPMLFSFSSLSISALITDVNKFCLFLMSMDAWHEQRWNVDTVGC